MSIANDKVSDVIAVLKLMMDEFKKASYYRNTTELRKEAVKIVAEKGLLAYRFKNETSSINTIHDACARRLKPDVKNISVFDKLADEWLRQKSMRLKDILLGHSESSSQRTLVNNFFENGH